MSDHYIGKKYTGTTKRGQVIYVFFRSGTEAIAASDDLSALFFLSPIPKQPVWHNANPRLKLEWGPVIEELYRQYLDDIITREDKDVEARKNQS